MMQSETRVNGVSGRAALGRFGLVAALEVAWLAMLVWLASRS